MDKPGFGLFVVAIGVICGVFGTSGNRAARTADPTSQQVAGGPWRETRVRRSGDGHFYVHAMVNGQLVRFMVDTGATGVALTVRDARHVGIPVDRRAFTVIGSGASGPVRGQFIELDSVEVEGKLASNVRGAVAEGLDISLLGQSYLSRLDVRMGGDEMILR